jgi:diguanylate cyclase (GGDEF)-like protein
MFRSKILRKFLLVIVMLVIVYTVAIVFVALPKIDATIKDLEEQNAKEVLNKVVLLTDNVARNLEDFKKESLSQHKKELKDIIDIVHSMMRETHQQSILHPEEREKLKAEALERISKLQYAHSNYIFVVDYNATMLSHPYIPRGSDMRNVKDITGKLIVPELIRVAREHGEGYISYWWKKNNSDEKPYEKLTYSRDCSQWQMVIGTGVYIDDIQKEVARRKQELFDELRQIMKKTKIGKTGYIYIFDKQNMIIHPNSNIEGKNFKKLPNPGKGTYIYDDLVKAAEGSGMLRYKWDKPSDKDNYIYDKVSWIQYVPSMDLYVVSSAYVDELEEVSTKLHDQIIYLGILILLISLLLSTLYLHRLFRPIHQLAETAKEIAEGNYHVRAAVNSNDEVGLLARHFNIMVNRLEDQIRNLDRKIREKTRALQELAITDALTRLYNRRYFSEVSTEMYALGKREQTPLSVIMLDIDKFKHINDTYGHQVGDRVIVALAGAINEVKRNSDIACRYGGEEFILLLPETGKEGACGLAERLRQMIEGLTIELEDGRVVTFTVSLGVSEVNYLSDKDIEDVIRRADDAMYRAKKKGRNQTAEL